MSDSHEHAPADPHSHEAHHVAKHIRMYLLVGGLLMVFTAITVALSYFDFGSMSANIIVAMIVASIKAGLVAAIFMHLASEKWTIYRLLIVTVFFAVGLFFLTWLHYVDPITL